MKKIITITTCVFFLICNSVYSQDNKQLKDSDKQILVNYFNEFLQVFQQKNIRSFARYDKNEINIFFEKNADISPTGEDSDMFSEIKKLEQDLIRNLIFTTITKGMPSENDIWVFKQCDITSLNFNLDIFYSDNSQSKIKKHLLINDLESLRTPFSKRDILGIIY